MLKLKLYIVNIIIFIIFFAFSDIIFSNFIFTQNVDSKCYEYSNKGKFYGLKENCLANMRIVSTLPNFKIETDNNGYRYSGKNEYKKNKNIIFVGDSQTFGLGSNWEDTFVGILEKKLTDYNLYNLGVPSYSPTVYKYRLENFIFKTNKPIEKVFVLVDITDVRDENSRWREDSGKPYLISGINKKYQKSKFRQFKHDNFKGMYLIASKLRKFSRHIRSKKTEDQKQKIYKPVEGSPSGAFIYTNFSELEGCNTEEKQPGSWTCGGVKQGLSKIENKIIEIGNLSKKNNFELYLITMPWPDTLNFGQTVFNWEKFNNNLCKVSKCKKLINVFPEYSEIKKNNENWLEQIYLPYDVHLTKIGNNIIAQKILKEVFSK